MTVGGAALARVRETRLTVSLHVGERRGDTPGFRRQEGGASLPEVFLIERRLPVGEIGLHAAYAQRVFHAPVHTAVPEGSGHPRLALTFENYNKFIISLIRLKARLSTYFLSQFYPWWGTWHKKRALPHPHRQCVIPAEITKRIAAEACCRGSFPAERQSNTGQPPALGRYSWNENRGQMESVEVAA